MISSKRFLQQKSRFSTLGTNRAADPSTLPLLGGTFCRDRPWGGRAYQDRKVNSYLPHQFQRTLQNFKQFSFNILFFLSKFFHEEWFKVQTSKTRKREKYDVDKNMRMCIDIVFQFWPKITVSTVHQIGTRTRLANPTLHYWRCLSLFSLVPFQASCGK